MCVVECDSCKDARLCPARSEMHRITAFAWAHGKDAPPCPFYAARLHHGVEGVIACRSPRPSRSLGVYQ